MSEFDNTPILLIPSMEEIKNAMWSLHPLKAQGWMGSYAYFMEHIGALFETKL